MSAQRASEDITINKQTQYSWFTTDLFIKCNSHGDANWAHMPHSMPPEDTAPWCDGVQVTESTGEKRVGQFLTYSIKKTLFPRFNYK